MRLKHVPEAEGIIQSSPYCIEKPEENKGQWKLSLNNTNPIHIEIGMGKGKFINAMASNNPSINYVGVEKYSSVLYKAIDKVADKTNILYICNDATLLPEFFEKNEIDRIYLNFSDPWPKARHEKRRLTSHRFLDVYEQILVNSGKLELKTDNVGLFDFSCESLSEKDGWKLLTKTYDLWNDPVLSEGNVTTEYEDKFISKGQKICKLIAEYEG